MLSRKYISNFFFDVTSAETTDDLWTILVSFCKEFDLLHGRISVYELDHVIEPQNFIHLRTYPEGPGSWAQHYLDKELYLHDRSFHLVFELGTETLEWLEMDRLTRTGTEANRVFVEMRDFGIGNGLLIANASLVTRKTILMGLAGPTESFKLLKKRYYEQMLHCLRTFNDRYIDVAIRNGDLKHEIIENPNYSPRGREVAKLMSQDLTNAQIAEKLGISVSGVNETVKRLKRATGMKTRTGLVANALRSGEIR